MKKSSTFKEKVHRNLYVLLSATLALLSIALLSISVIYLRHAALMEGQYLSNEIFSHFSQELNSADFFPVAAALETELQNISWKYISLRLGSDVIFKKENQNSLPNILSVTSTKSLRDENRITIEIITTPKERDLFWTAVVNLCNLILTFSCFILIARSIGKETEIEARRTNRMASLVHDLRGMAGTIRTLTLDEDADSRKETISLVTRRFERMILSVQKPEHTSVTGNAVTLFELLKDVVISVPEFRNGKSVDIDPSVKDVFLQELLLSQDDLWRVFFNLLKNAAHPFAEVTSVKIALITAAPTLTIIISDDGRGMPQIIEDSIFEKGSTFGKIDGTGMGLAWVKETLTAVGGDITLNKSDIGTTFTLKFRRN